MPTLRVAGGGKVGRQSDNYGAGNYAMVTEGSWNTKTYLQLKGVTHSPSRSTGTARTWPRWSGTGPTCRR